LAEQFVNDFVSYTPNGTGSERTTPKTLSLVETALFADFVPVMEDLLLTMTILLNAEQDAHFFSHLHRARALAVTYDTNVDSGATDVDLGSFLQEFSDQCHPSNGNELSNKLLAATTAYNVMFVQRGFGQGTVEGTGMVRR
jgi:hypothetical protein